MAILVQPCQKLVEELSVVIVDVMYSPNINGFTIAAMHVEKRI